jgi:hypothetical protein
MDGRGHLTECRIHPIFTKAHQRIYKGTTIYRTNPGTNLHITQRHVDRARDFQPTSRNDGLTGALSLCVAGQPQSYAVATHSSGYFTVTSGLPDGQYNSRIKGLSNPANAGVLTLSGGSRESRARMLGRTSTATQQPRHNGRFDRLQPADRKLRPERWISYLPIV